MWSRSVNCDEAIREQGPNQLLTEELDSGTDSVIFSQDRPYHDTSNDFGEDGVYLRD